MLALVPQVLVQLLVLLVLLFCFWCWQVLGIGPGAGVGAGGGAGSTGAQVLLVLLAGTFGLLPVFVVPVLLVLALAGAEAGFFSSSFFSFGLFAPVRAFSQELEVRTLDYRSVQCIFIHQV
jgi:hypothetical protein